MAEVDLVSGEENEEEEGGEEVPPQRKGKKKAESSPFTPKEKFSKKRKTAVSDPEKERTSSKCRKKSQRKIAIIGRDEWFVGLMVLKGRVIDPAVVTMFRMKELMEKLEVQRWTHLFLSPLSVIYG